MIHKRKIRKGRMSCSESVSISMKVTKKISISEVCTTDMEQKVNESWEQYKYPEKLND